MRCLGVGVVAFAFAGCAHGVFLGDRCLTTYYDRNYDGRVDFEFHDNGGGDSDWALSDTDFDAFYDRWLRYGILMGSYRVHMPVPVGVPISKKPLPVIID